MLFSSRPTPQKYVFYFLTLALLVGVVILLERLVSESIVVQELLQGWGYLGIFIASIISGFNIVVPVPIVAFMPAFLAAGLSAWFTIGIIALGMTIGDALGLLIGNAGSRLMSEEVKAVHKRMLKWREKYHVGPLVFLFFYVMIAPLPNELVVIPLGFLGYKLRTVFPIVLIGNLIFNTLVFLGILNVVSFVQTL